MSHELQRRISNESVALSDGLQRPTSNDDHEGWKAYWAAQGMPWRTEPEIESEAKEFLTQHLSILPSIEKGIFPFRMVRLSRATVEWLLATHESKGIQGPVNVEDGVEQDREGLDLRGALLSMVDLSGLPLARIKGGLTREEWETATGLQRQLAAVELEGAYLQDAHLEESVLSGAKITVPALREDEDWESPVFPPGSADKPLAYLVGTKPESNDRPESAFRVGVAFQLKQRRQGSSGVHFERAVLIGASFSGSDLKQAHFDGAILDRAMFYGAQMMSSCLDGASLVDAELASANLTGASLEGADLRSASLGGAILENANLRDADVRGARCDAFTHFNGAHLEGVALEQARLDDTNLAVVDWSTVKLLGDEKKAYQIRDTTGISIDRLKRLRRFEAAVRANRQVAILLRQQGLNEDADRFAYRAQRLQRTVFRRQGKGGRMFSSWLLDAVSGYGYKPMRSVVAYIAIILLFAGAYLFNAQFAAPHLTWDEAIVLSISAFHGRGFFTTSISLGDTLTRLAAGEAIVGLLIEITFIATFTQRFFAR